MKLRLGRQFTLAVAALGFWRALFMMPVVLFKFLLVSRYNQRQRPAHA